MPHETGFNAADNPYTESEFLKICEAYGVPNDPMRYKDETFYWTYQHGISWPNDYIGPDSMTRWIIEKSVGFTDVGLLRILLQKVLGQFLGIVGMALAEYDLPTKPTNIGRFYLGFLGICRQKVISAKDCWQYWWTLAFKNWQTWQST